MPKRYWLMKSEPEAFSIDDLAKLPNGSDDWDGVRNYQARNFMRDDMQKGDLAFFYHSNCKTPGIVGIMEIVDAAHPDVTALDPDSKYYDPKASPDNPRWYCVTVQYKKKLPLISLSDLKENPKLKDLGVVKKGSRLSVLPVSKAQWDAILNMT